MAVEGAQEGTSLGDLHGCEALWEGEENCGGENYVSHCQFDHDARKRGVFLYTRNRVGKNNIVAEQMRVVITTRPATSNKEIDKIYD